MNTSHEQGLDKELFIRRNLNRYMSMPYSVIQRRSTPLVPDTKNLQLNAFEENLSTPYYAHLFRCDNPAKGRKECSVQAEA